MPYPELYDDKLESLLVLAPHPDDEIIGCGGLLLKYRYADRKIVFITDGSKGDPYIGKKELIEIRKSESQNVLHSIGINKIDYLEIEDGKVMENVDVIKENLKKDISKYQNIITPFVFDNHIDHLYTTKALYEILKECKKSDNTIWLYEGWSPLIPNLLVNITQYIDQKKELIRMYKSQIKHIAYDEKIVGLNSYRSIGAGLQEIKS